LLDATPGDAGPFRQVADRLASLANSKGAVVSRFCLEEIRLAPCLGDFECWTKTPGLCRTQDDAQSIARAFQQADLAILVTPLLFGGYSPALKTALDRLLGVIHPFFRQGIRVTRHAPRYDRYPALFFVGLEEEASPPERELFTAFAGGNAINLMAPCFHTLTLAPGREDWQDVLEHRFTAALSGQDGETFPHHPPADALARACLADTTLPPGPVLRAALLVGSARPRGESTSESLARGLAEKLEQQGVATGLVHVIDFIKPGRRREAALATLGEADLLVVAAPLYVDGLPGLALKALQQIATRPGRLRRVAGLLNSGYPEAGHNRSAMAQLRRFAHHAGLGWAGGLAMGAGEVLHGKPLAAMPLMLRSQISALEKAAAALASGLGIPPAATTAMARPLLPAWLFRLAAKVRWFLDARRQGTPWNALGARPHELKREEEPAKNGG
jgi:multimeric flavodoxin WrbA